MQSFCFHSFGLHFQADVLLPGLVASQPVEDPDVCIYLHTPPPEESYHELEQKLKVPGKVFEQDLNDELHRKFWLDEEQKYFYLAYKDGPSFVINRKGSRIWVIQPPVLSKAELVLYLITALGVTLRIRGLFCIHASAIVVDGSAVAFIGSSGSGKSTTAAAFVKMGYSLLADDILAVDDESAPLLVWPSFPRLRLWPNAAAFLYGSAEALPCLLPDWEKRYLDLSVDSDCFHESPLPLGAIYILGKRVSEQTSRIEPVTGAKSMVALLTNIYQNELLSREVGADEFRSLHKIIKQVPIRHVHPSENLKDLPMLCETILADFQEVATGR